MKTPEQIANLNMLIDHYKALPYVIGWSYSQCVMGVMTRKHIVSGKYYDYDGARALGVDDGLMQYLIAGPRIIISEKLDPVEFRDRVVEVLEGVRDEKSVGWDGLEI